MPACSSDIFNSGTGYRSSSPPNSRSNSASPPLSVSPSHDQSTGTFKRSISNLSNSSFSHPKTIFCEHHNETSADGTLGTHRNPAFLTPEQDHHRHHQNHHHHHHRRNRTTEREADEDRASNSSARRIFEQVRSEPDKSWFLPARIVAWYFNLVFRVLRRLNETLSYVVWAPVVWISAWICVFWVITQLPLNLIKWFLRAIYTPSFELSRSKRCVLITGGSTIQALHLARNFYKAGARVVVCEIDGLFGLARFSTACSRFYNVPRPGPGTAAEYVNALKTIVERERVVYFIPVSCTSGAYYDALAKPHLEIAGCECFVPSASDVTSLEDPLQLIQRSSSLGLPSPTHRVVRSSEDLVRLYESGYFAVNDRHSMISVGPTGMTERAKLHLPAPSVDNNRVPRNLREKLEAYEISERRPWIVIREKPPAGSSTGYYQLVTCTTVKDSRVVANVTCRLDETRGLVPEERSDVNQWLEIFFRGPFAKRINGHLSFKLAFNGDNESSQQGLVPISCRVGVPLPYLCLTSVHPRLVWRPCRHFSRQNSVNLVVSEKYKRTISSKHRSASTDGLFAARSSSTIVREDDDSSTRIDDSGASRSHFVIPSSPVLDKRDALFVYWDPLPYCAYYHLQFPFRRLAGAIRERPAQHKPPLAVVQ